MAILLGQALEKLAEVYRKYGNIPLYVETESDKMDGVVNLDIDIGNIRKRGVALVLETASLHRALREEQAATRTQVTKRPMSAVPPGDNSETQELPTVTPANSPPLPERVTNVKPRQDSGRHRQSRSSSSQKSATAS